MLFVFALKQLLFRCFGVFCFLTLPVLAPQAFGQDNLPVYRNTGKPLILYAGNNFVSKYIPNVDMQISDGMSNQTLITAAFVGFKVYGWGNFGFPEKHTNIKFRNALSVNNYIFPNATLNNWVFDNIFKIFGLLHFSIQYSHLFANERVSSSNRVYRLVEWPIPYCFIQYKSVLKPEVLVHIIGISMVRRIRPI